MLANLPCDKDFAFVNTTTRQVTFRDGKEVLDPAPATAPTAAASGPARAADELGLRSWGEFGPALTVVLADIASHTDHLQPLGANCGWPGRGFSL